ncbi:response regulator [Kitasatospora griseola]
MTGHCYDVSILDIMLPGLNGYRVCSRLRAVGSDVGILVRTAKDGEWDAAGLGLAIARDIATLYSGTLHGGTLRIEAAGAGATFRTRLPGTAPSPGGR